MSARARGHVFQPTWTRNGVTHTGSVWHATWSEGGRRFRESTGSTTEAGARVYLAARLTGRQEETADLTVNQLGDRIRRRYERDGLNRKRLETSLKHLLGRLGGWRARDVTAVMVEDYIEARLGEGAANATVNRELAALKRAYKLVGLTPPPFDMLLEATARSGFFEAQDFADVLAELPDEVQPVALLGYYLGFRKGEILNLPWSAVDFDAGFIRLENGTTKNGHGRTVPIYPQVLDVLRGQALRKAEVEARTGKVVETVCFRYESGDRIKSIKGAWSGACSRAGVDRLFHDLRRTAVRNMVLAGISTHSAMAVSGHRSPSVFARYAILQDPATLTEVGQSLGARLGALPTRREV